MRNYSAITHTETGTEPGKEPAEPRAVIIKTIKNNKTVKTPSHLEFANQASF